MFADWHAFCKLPWGPPDSVQIGLQQVGCLGQDVRQESSYATL